MNIFRQLRWKLTWSYTIVTVSAFLVITLILGGLVFTQIFVQEDLLDPEQMIDNYINNRTWSSYPLWRQILSQSPVDSEMINLFLDYSRSVITNEELFRIGAIHFSASTESTIRVLILDEDGILLGSSVPDDPLFRAEIGHPLDPKQVPGLEAPFKAAMAGETDPKRLYTTLEPNQRYVFAAPLFDRAGGVENQVVGIIVIIFDAVPTQGDIPSHVLMVAARSLLIFLLGVGIMGAIFGSFFAHGLTTRFKRISEITDLWSMGDFSRYIDDTTGDEITQFAQRLNNMAKQLQDLLRRRQDMAVSEERNRLARDLHDSAKQQALAASLELGTALALYERDPEGAKKHLTEADTLVDSVRKELTDLVDELRPQAMDGQDFSETLKDRALEWSRRSGIELSVAVGGYDELPLATRETLLRIAQEALANVARHSSARHVGVILEYGTNIVTLIVKDDGRGFDPNVKHEGLGLHSMRERAEALGGTFSLESAPGQGTTIKVDLPKGS
jgi:signal transduction histidine kinase